MRLNPQYPAWYPAHLGWAYRLVGRYEEAIVALKQALARSPNDLGVLLNLAATYSELGRMEEARAEVAEVLRLSPNFSLEMLRQMNPQKDPALAERSIEALRKAGLK
jgi:tetratricopeptide (TPR) repeat protein